MASKRIPQDVIPPKRSIRDIEVPREKRIAERMVKIKEVEAEEKPKKIFKENNHKKSKTGKYFAIGVVLVALAFGVSAFFKSAIIKVTPKTDTKTFSETFSAQKDAVSGLGFQLVTISKDVEKTVSATGQKQASIKARGKIVIFNNYGTESQKLVATTRFQTPEGLIFRLINPITIPGKQVIGAATIPGSVEVTVEADKPGPDYNIGLKDFTIPGFKGDPRYSTIYARSKTTMTGGFTGMQASVSPDAIKQAESDLESDLKTSLTRDLSRQIPANFVLYPRSLSFYFEPVSESSSANGSAVLKKSGTTNAIIFDKGSLSRAILAKVLSNTNDNVKITNLPDLNFAYVDQNIDVSKANNISFTLNGNANLVWVFDQNKLKSDLLGLSKQKAEMIIATYPAVKEAWVETKPFWNQTIPSDSSKVTLINTVGQ